MTDIQMIPLNKLDRDPMNVRKTYRAEGIIELAASIKAEGPLQNIIVRPGDKKGRFYVSAGGRRFAAYTHLVETGEWPKDQPIECKVREADEATEVCLTENVQREAMHRADEFEAFLLLAEAGKTPKDIAERFGTSELVVKGPESGKGAAGKWTDAATGEHGDLLDVIRESCGLVAFRDVANEARRFLTLPHPEPEPERHNGRKAPAPTGSPHAAKRLFSMAKPIASTLAESYFRNRGITALQGTGSLRFHPRCYYRPDEHSSTETWPALIASVTDLDGHQTGAHRTWLDPNGISETTLGKAPIETPRRAMGDLLGHAVRFGVAGEVMAAGEGIETMLSLRCVLPKMPMAAGLSAAHLAAILFPDTLRRLYIVRDDDPAGDGARDTLVERADALGIEALPLSPMLGDLNEDLRLRGIDAFWASIRVQLAPQDVARFMTPVTMA